VVDISSTYGADPYETLGLGGQIFANQPKFAPIGKELSQMGDIVPIAAGSANPEALAKTGFGGNKVFVGVGDEAGDIASMYAKEGVLRGSPFGTPTTEPLMGVARKGDINFGRNLFGHLEGVVSPDVANKAFNLPSSGIVTVVPESFYTRLGRLAPGANIALGGASAINRFNQGQYLRALAAGVSMIPGPLGYLGLGAETAMDVGEALINKSKQDKAKQEVIKQQRAQNAAKAQESRNQSRDDYTGGGGTVVIGKGGGQTKTVSPRSREAMYSAPTRRSSPPPFRRFNDGGIVSLFGRF